MSESAKRRCTPEWRKSVSERLSTVLNESQVSKMYASGMTQSEIAVALGTTQKVVWKFMLRHGLKSRVAAKRNQSGEANHMWKGRSASYKAFHCRMNSLHGRPKRCDICGTTDPTKTYDWASLSKKYDDASDYKRMCRSCHFKHDKIILNITKGGSNAGRKKADVR